MNEITRLRLACGAGYRCTRDCLKQLIGNYNSRIIDRCARVANSFFRETTLEFGVQRLDALITHQLRLYGRVAGVLDGEIQVPQEDGFFVIKKFKDSRVREIRRNRGKKRKPIRVWRYQCPRSGWIVRRATRILNDEPPSLRAVPGVPDWLAKLVSQLFRKNPGERPQTATEVLRRLERSTATSDRGPTRALSLPQWFARPRGVRLALLFVGAGVLAAASLLFFYFVLPSHAPRPSAQASKSAASAASVAVLPFAILSSGEDNAYFAQGFHDELLRQLGRIGDLRVISRTSVMQYKDSARNLREIAEALGVSSIVRRDRRRAERAALGRAEEA